jgi:hypothetical protein
MLPSRNDIGAYISPRRALAVQDATAGAIPGPGIDRSGFDSCVLHVAVGTASGTPDSFSVAGKLQESDDNSAFSDIAGASIAAIATDASEAHVNVNLAGCKQYVRAVVTPAFVNGTSPKIEVAATIVLGGAHTLPTT